VARPWPKRSAWPRVGKRGRRSYSVGFYDHDKRERTRTFPTAHHARAWMDDYITAERRGSDSLRRFLLDLDAKEANQAEMWSLGAVLELYLQVNAHPRNEGGLAPSTYKRYESVIHVHLLGRPREEGVASRRYARAVAAVPAVRFNGPQAPRAWREQMLREGVPQKTREQAWHTLSAALTWAASSQLVEEIQVNGCRLASEPRSRRRRSQREGRHRIRSSSPSTRRARGQLGSLSAGCRGDPGTAIAAHKPQGTDPRTSRRDDREPAVRALPAPPGGLGSAMGLAHRRVRLGSRGSLQRRAQRLG
jgi:hypothetical protein